MRRGPRPLLLHLMLAWLRSTAFTGELQNWNSAWSLWRAAAPPPAGPSAAGASSPEAESTTLPPDIMRDVWRQNAAMIAGMAAYRRHPARRAAIDPAPIWTEGETRLMDYAPAAPGPPVLFVPSLVNRGYILDLDPDHSLIGHLRASGLRPMLLDWGWPGPVERQFTLTDYIAGRLERAIAAVGQPLILAGYCMGGLLALAAAQRQPRQVKGLVLLATPWDFRAADPEGCDALIRLLPMLNPLLDFGGAMPVDVLQSLFALMDPAAVAEKFRRFGRLAQDGPKARLFVALEDWVNDGVPLAAPVARECLSGWYGRNAPANAEWRIAGMTVDPAAIIQPCFVAVPGRDRIVPPESAWPLARALRNATVIEPAGGHVSMVVSGSAAGGLRGPLVDWLRALCW